LKELNNMWKSFFIAAALLLPGLAFAQSTAPDPNVQALSQSVIDLTGQNVQLRAQIIALQQENAKLKAPSASSAASPSSPPAVPEPPSPHMSHTP
jgi:hypothetical protein